MIRTSRSLDAPPAALPDSTPPGPSKLVELRDIDFNFGPQDDLAVTLGPADKFRPSDTQFELVYENGEVVLIDRSKVRWWSIRKRTVAEPLKSIDPAQ